MATTIIDNGDAGYTTVGSWNAFGSGHGGDLDYNSSGSGTNKARWTFTGLTGGVAYLISWNWLAGSDRGTNVPWTIYDSDNTTVLKSGLQNQVRASNDFTDAGTGWRWAGEVSPTGTSLRFEITDNCNGLVVADAVRLQPLSDGLPAGSADCTSVIDGAWSAAATWAPAAVPVSGNTVVVADAVTVSGSQACGTSPAEGNTVLTVRASSSLMIQTGATLAVKGDIANSGTVTVGEAGGGGTLEFDASGAASPTLQNYKLNNTDGTARIVIRGTSGAHSVFRSNSGGGNAYMAAIASASYLDAQWCDFLRLGDSATDIWSNSHTNNPASAVTILSLADCTFTDCGRFASAVNFPANAGLSIVRTKFISGEHATDDVRLVCTAPGGGVTRVVNYCAFSKMAVIAASSVAIDHCMFGAEMQDPGGATAALEITDSVFWKDVVGSSAHPLAGNYTNCYFYAGGTDNPHFPTPLNVGVSKTVTGCIVEYGGDFNVDSGNSFYGTGTWNLVSCIILPSGKSPSVSSGAVTFSGPSITLTHCTLHSNPYSGGILIGDGGSSAGTYPTVKSNLFWARLADVDGKAATDIPTSADNTLTPGNCTHNGLVNMVNPAYEGNYPTTQPGANDVRLDATDESTVFVDNTRNLSSWAVTQGSVAGTYALKVADAKTYLLADPSLVTSLLAHVRGGFIVKLASLRTTAHDGTVIGAVQDSPFINYSLTCDSGTFTITGTAASLEYGYELAADPGSYAITGTAASLEVGYKLTCASGSYLITGTAATLTEAGTFSLVCDAGSFAVTGTAAGLRYSRLLSCVAGAFSITGQNASLVYSDESSTPTITGLWSRVNRIVLDQPRLTLRG